ncbi:MAG: metallophosphoesterase [Candidatus Nezhaarchaeota archaeon]|nr:metallophosphoesterase [Candidatus Nezhaarchaeota archaeon]
MAKIKFVVGIPASIIITERRRKVVTASDLHIGLEYELQTLGFKVPSQTSEVTKGLFNLLMSIRPDVLVLLGDVKHEIGRLRKRVEVEVEGFIRRTLELTNKVVIIMGNHDGSLKHLRIDGVEIYDASGVSIDDVSFIHGNAWPKPELFTNNVLVMGHVHPSIAIPYRDGRVWIVYYISKKIREKISRKFNVDVNIKRLIVHPAYNSYLGRGSLNVENFRKLSPLFRGLINPLRGYVYCLDGTFIGKFSSLMSGIE